MTDIQKNYPAFQQVHQDVPLTNLSIAYFQDPSTYGLMNVFPRVPSPFASNKFYTFDRAYFLASRAEKRASGSPAPITGFALSTDNFSVERDSIGGAIPDPDRANADPGVDLDATVTAMLNQQLLIKMETRYASAFFGTGIWTTNPTVSVTWDDPSSSPVADIINNKRTVAQLAGASYIPNVLALGYKCFDDLCQHPDILDRIKYSAGPGNPAIANEQTLAQVFGVDRIVVCRAIANTGPEAGTASYGAIVASRSALLCYAAPSPGMRTPSAGYTFMWTAAPDGSSFGPAIKRWRDYKNESDVLEANVWYQPKVISADLGVFFNNAVAA